jgi:multiple sugar transport system permease protein
MGMAQVLRSKKTQRDLMWGLIFISPWIIGFTLFTLYPTMASFYYSFTDKALIKPPKLVGFENYINLFTDDDLFGKAIYNTFYMVIFSVTLNITIAFLTALLLNMKIHGQAFFRTIFYLPTIMPPVAGVLLWLWIMNPQYGILNTVLGWFGIQGPAWFSSPMWSKPAVLFMGVWGIGGSTILFLAALKGVPVEFYESAMLDGANWVQRTLKITIPLVSPVSLFIAITSTIAAFQIFTQSYIASRDTLGAPRESLLFYAIYIYRNAFVYLKMGYASAMAWVLFLIILVVTFIQLRASSRFTHYEM